MNICIWLIAVDRTKCVGQMCKIVLAAIRSMVHGHETIWISEARRWIEENN